MDKTVCMIPIDPAGKKSEARKSVPIFLLSIAVLVLCPPIGVIMLWSEIDLMLFRMRLL